MKVLTELEEWQQAASVEADLRREFAARLSWAESEIEIYKQKIETLQAELVEERTLKQGWIDEFTKLRDMGKMPKDEY